MKITLQNIGIIKNSTIQLDGLTVITGKNNSGKTTVGKVLYSILDAVVNLQDKAQNDKRYYIQNKLGEIGRILEIFRFIYKGNSERINLIFGEESMVNKLWNREYRSKLSHEEIQQFARILYQELLNIDFDIFVEDKNFPSHNRRILSKNGDPLAIIEKLQEHQKKCLNILDALFEDLNKDLELIDYARECINQTLRVEFSNQIQPIAIPVKKSKIELSDKDSILFDFQIIDNKVENDGKPVFISSPYSKVYFIDNPFIIDALSQIGYFREQEAENTTSFLNTERILTHENKLKFVLKSGKRPTIFEETVLNNSLAPIKEQIDQVIPGEFEFNSDDQFYVQNGNKLKISNLATGSKLFSIIKILIEKGEICNDTMLVLDEPESHLHPSWQNKFAEIIVLLVKELDVNILLTTHSPNFMLAIDAHMRKYNIARKTNFYQTNPLKGGFIEYCCVNDDMGKIYADFMQYLSEVKALRDSLIEN